MHYRRLGKTGYQVSEIGMGCWQFGGNFGTIDDSVSQATMDAAHAAGVTFWDTADVYGAGRSERQIGIWRQRTGGDPVIATKVGRSGDLFPGNYDESAIRRHLEESCERLGLSSLPLIQLHCVPPAVLEDGSVFAIMDKMQSEGLCQNWGASVETIAEAQTCLKQPGLATLQIIFNLYRQNAAWDLFDAAESADVGIIVRLPLASGLLTGKFAADQTFAEDDHRNYNANGEKFSVGETFSGIELAKGVEALEHLRPLVPEGMSLADFSLRWILDHPAVSSLIAGCSRPEQVERNARVSDLPHLTDLTHEALEKVYRDEIEQLVRCPI